MSDYAHDITLTPDERRRLDAVYAALAAAPRPSAAAVADATRQQTVAYRIVNVCRRLGVRL